MSASPKQSPLAVRILDLIKEAHGDPTPGHGEHALRAAVCKLASQVAEVYAHRDLQREEAAMWQRMRTTGETPQPGRH